MSLRSPSGGPRKATYERRCVTCQKCQVVIPLRTSRVGNEFAVQCPSCGMRGYFSPKDIKIRQLPERRMKKQGRHFPERRAKEQ